MPPPFVFPLNDCQIAIGAPILGEDGSPLHFHGTLTVQGNTYHDDPEVAMDFMAVNVQHPPCDDPPDGELPDPACTLATDTVTIPASELFEEGGVKGNFTASLNLSALPTGEYDVVAAAVTKDKGAQAAGTCETRVRIFVDNTCPDHVVDGTPPLQDGDHLLGTLPIKVRAYDDSAIQSARILGPAGEVLAELPLTDEGKGVQFFTKDIDICKYGTGPLTFSMMFTDTFGTTCTTALKQHVTRCPDYVTSTVTTPEAGAELTYMTDYDVDQDGATDIVGTNKDGVVVLRNDGNGKLGKPEQIAGIEGASYWVFPDDFDGKNGTDFAVIVGAGAATELRIYLRGPVCEKLPDFDSTIYSEDELALIGHYPTTCVDGYNLVEKHVIGAAVSAAIYRTHPTNPKDLVLDPQVNAHQERVDLVLGTDTKSKSLTIFVRAETPTCVFWPPDWNWDGTPKEPNPAQVATCFRPPAFFAGPGKVSALALADFVEDDLMDVAAAFEAASPIITVYENIGDGTFKAAWGNYLPKIAVALWPLEKLNDDDHMDLLAVMRDMNQVWAIFGDGAGGFRKTNNTLNPQDVDRVAVCIEGRPSAFAVTTVDDDGSEDMVVVTLDHGTAWTFYNQGIEKYGATWGPSFTTAYTDQASDDYGVPQIVDIVPEPVQLLLVKLNKDDHWDAVARSANGPIGVLYGANPDAAPGNPGIADPDFGSKGTFVGSHHAPTPLPKQSVADIWECGHSNQQTNGVRPYLGAPGDRLEPEFMAFDDFQKDNDGRPDLVVTTKSSYVFEGYPIQPQNEKLRVPILSYLSNGYAPIVPGLDVTGMRPFTSYCKDGAANTPATKCTQKAGLPKGPVVDVKAATSANSGILPDLFVATSTFFMSPGEGEDALKFTPLEALDIILDDNGKSVAKQWEAPMPPAATPGDWFKLGSLVASRPKSIAPLKCKSNGQFVDLAILAEVQTKDYTRAALGIHRSLGFKTKDQTLSSDYQLLAKDDFPFIVKTGILGAAGGDDTTTDLFLASKSFVTVFVGKGNCVFEQGVNASVVVGSGAVGLAVGNLNEDLFTDIVVPLSDGTVAVVQGLDGMSFDQADLSLHTEGSTPLQAELGDVNGDGWLDILVLDGALPRVLAYMNEGLGPLAPPSFWPTAQILPVGKGAKQLYSGDLDGDGCIDLATLNKDAKSVSFLRSEVFVLGECKQQGSVEIP